MATAPLLQLYPWQPLPPWWCHPPPCHRSKRPRRGSWTLCIPHHRPPHLESLGAIKLYSKHFIRNEIYKMSKKNTPRLHSVQLARETLIRKMNYLRKIWSKLHLGRQNHFWDILCLQESWQAVSKSLVLLNTCLPHNPIGPRSAKLPNWQWTLGWWIDSFNVENNFVTSNMLYRQKNSFVIINF